MCVCTSPQLDCNWLVVGEGNPGTTLSPPGVTVFNSHIKQVLYIPLILTEASVMTM